MIFAFCVPHSCRQKWLFQYVSMPWGQHDAPVKEVFCIDEPWISRRKNTCHTVSSKIQGYPSLQPSPFRCCNRFSHWCRAHCLLLSSIAWCNDYDQTPGLHGGVFLVLVESFPRYGKDLETSPPKVCELRLRKARISRILLIEVDYQG